MSCSTEACRNSQRAAADRWQKAHPDHRRKYNRRYRTAHPERRLWTLARQRAYRDGIPFNILPSDIVIPPACPVFGTPWRQPGTGPGPDSMTLDRLRSDEGYQRGNLAVISHRANTLKRDATAKEMRRLADWMEKQGL